MLSWIERQVATRLFSAPPTSTPHEAMEYFQKCETLRAFMDNRFYMAKCYYAQNNIPEAKKWLDLAASMPATTATVILDGKSEIPILTSLLCRTKLALKMSINCGNSSGSYDSMIPLVIPDCVQHLMKKNFLIESVVNRWLLF